MKKESTHRKLKLQREGNLIDDQLLSGLDLIQEEQTEYKTKLKIIKVNNLFH